MNIDNALLSKDILRCEPAELEALLAARGQPAYRARQLFSQLHRGVAGFDLMSDLPLSLRENLAKDFTLPYAAITRRQRAEDGTEKLLWRLQDGETVESVVMQYRDGDSVCVSTQAGCRQGCAFCASTLGGLSRNLTAGEILAQVLYGAPTASKVVLMGIGEPLDNFDETVRFLQLLSNPKGRGMSLRHVSLSTCGLVPEIQRLAALKMPLTLSVSLHGADDELRSRLMPINRVYGLQSLISVCKQFVTNTGRRVSYEYVMIKGVTDTREQASKLFALLRGHPAHLNLIPLNPVEGKPWVPSAPTTLRQFADFLLEKGLTVTIRRKLGDGIEAACGQLRRQLTVDN